MINLSANYSKGRLVGGGEWVCGVCVVCVCGGGGCGGRGEDSARTTVEHCSVASHIVDQRLNCP